MATMQEEGTGALKPLRHKSEEPDNEAVKQQMTAQLGSGEEGLAPPI